MEYKQARNNSNLAQITKKEHYAITCPKTKKDTLKV